MDKKIFFNYLYNIAYQIVRVVIPLFIVPYLYLHVGAGTLGISDFASNIAAWFILFGILGVNIYGNRTIAKVRDNRSDLSRNFFEIFTMQVLNMTIATVCYFVYVNLTVSANIEIYYLTGIILIASMFDITWFFYGIEDFKLASIRNIIIKIVGVILILIFVKKPSDLYLYVIINATMELFGQLIMFLELRKYLDFEKISIKSAYQKHLRHTITLFIPTIAISVYTLLDQTMLGYLYNELNVNYYKTSMSFIKMFLYFITSIGAVMLPRVTNIFYNHEDGKNQAKHLVEQTLRIAMLLAIPMCVGMIAITPSFIPWYLPTAPTIGNLIMLGSPIIIFIAISNVTGTQYMIPTGMYKQYSTSVVIGALCNFAINIVLIPRFGAYGAIIGSLLAELIVTSIQYIFIRKATVLHIINISFFKYLGASILMFIVVWGVGKFLAPSIICNLIQATSGALTYFIVLILFKESLIISLLRKVTKHG